MSARSRALALFLGSVMLLAACAPQSAPTIARGGDTAGAPPPSTPKVLRLGTLREPSTGIALFAGSGTMAAQHAWMFHDGLAALDDKGNLQPRIAAKIPTLADGDWKVDPDGSMDVTWTLRPNVAWHDGVPVTADDFVFGIEVAKDPAVALPRTGQVQLIKGITAPDPQTVVVSWSAPYFGANRPVRLTSRRSPGGLWGMPTTRRHAGLCEPPLLDDGVCRPRPI